MPVYDHHQVDIIMILTCEQNNIERNYLERRRSQVVLKRIFV